MTFPNIRHIGESPFASAGLAALVAGLAARTALTNLPAGVQIAITQPFRLQDAVVVEGESGWIEQITTTYVVVRIWDLRRLVVPLTYFIERPFHNWTRRTADLLGTVFCLHQLQRASRRRPPGVARHSEVLGLVGWQSLELAGHQHLRPGNGVARAHDR
jgi:hypothetical protein